MFYPFKKCFLLTVDDDYDLSNNRTQVCNSHLELDIMSKTDRFVSNEENDYLAFQFSNFISTSHL